MWSVLSAAIATIVVALLAATPQDWVRSMARDLPAEVFQKPPGPAPTPAPAPSSAPAPATTKTADEPYVVEQLVSRVRVEDDGTDRREGTIRVRVQTEEGVKQWGQVVIGYNSATERLDIGPMEVHKPDGHVITANADAIQDLAIPISRAAPMYSDFRQKHVTVPSLRPGDVLSYRYIHTTHTPVVPGQFWFQFDFESHAIVLDERFELDVPANRKITLKVRPGVETGPVPATAASSDRRVYAWHGSHPIREDSKESDESKKAADAPATTDAQKKAPVPAIQISTFQSWDEVGRWYAGLVRDRATVNAAITAKAEALTRGKTTDVEKLEALSNFVAHEVRYVSISLGVGRYQPHAAADVLANQYGDCKDKHTLLAALASAAGLHVEPVLVHSSLDLDKDVPSPAQFDHVITVMPVGGNRADWIWTDSTSELTPFRYLARPLRGRTGLLSVDAPYPSSSSASSSSITESASLIELPKDPPFEPIERITMAGTISEAGALNVHVEFMVRNDVEPFYRAFFNRVPRSEWATTLRRAFGQGSGISAVDGTIEDVTASEPGDMREPFKFGFRLAAQSHIPLSSGSYSLPANRLVIPHTAERDWKGTEPVSLRDAIDRIKQVRLEFPANVTVRAPVNVSLVKDYAEYRTTYAVEGQTLTIERELRWKMRELPASRSADYLAFVRAVRADEEQQYVIEAKAGAAPSTAVAAGAGAKDLLAAAQRARTAGKHAEAIALYQRVVEAEPKHPSAWNSMGLSHLALAQLDEAEAAFRQQIAVNAFDQYAWNNLGLALRRQHKDDEAAAAYRKQIEINPLDQHASKNLGLLQRDRGQYAEARESLERAASITPKDATIPVALGGVFLHLKQDDQATASFDKAEQISATPLIWNNIAYELAKSHARLDRAQQYAESAIAAVATSLRQVTLDTLTVRAFADVQSLAMYWDTRGWVEVQRGDFASAERYINAAAKLAQRGELLDHLGQVYEREAKTADAIAAYAEALAVKDVQDPDETRSRLTKLAGSRASTAPQMEALVADGMKKLIEQRTIAIPRPSALAGDAPSASVLVVLDSTNMTSAEVKLLGLVGSATADASGGPGGSGGAGAASEASTGADTLAPLIQVLRTAHYSVDWPDNTPTKLVRRGRLQCASGAPACQLILDKPGDVHSLEP